MIERITALLEDFAVAPGWRQIWRVRRHQYDADFQQCTDKMMTEGKGQPLYPELIAEEG